jgi:preprotein translocase subunit SecE
MELTKTATSWPEQTRTYIEEVQAEMKRVTWPSWHQVRATTGVVIAAVFLFAAYFFVVDTFVNAGINRIITYFTHH